MTGIYHSVQAATPLTAGEQIEVPTWLEIAMRMEARGQLVRQHCFVAAHSDVYSPITHWDGATGARIAVLANGANDPLIERNRVGSFYSANMRGNGLEMRPRVGSSNSWTWFAAVHLSAAQLASGDTESISWATRTVNGVSDVFHLFKSGANRFVIQTEASNNALSGVISTPGNHVFIGTYDATSTTLTVYHNSTTATDTNAAAAAPADEDGLIYNIGSTASGATPWDGRIMAVAQFLPALSQPRVSQLMTAAMADYEV